MTLIKKMFIKNYKDINNPIVRNSYGVVAGILGIISNILLFVCKLILGIISGSITIVIDAINNITDACSSVLTFIGFKLSNKPADKEHPFGHERYEYVMGLIISVIILAVGVTFSKTCIEKIISPEHITINFVTYIILSISILIKVIQMIIYFNFAKAINSDTLKASGLDSRNDIITTSAVLISMIIMHIFNINIDGYIGLIVSIFVIISSIKMIKETISPLISEKPQKELVKLIKKEILSFNGVDDIHDLQIHNYGTNTTFVAVHIEVPAKTTLLDSHELVEKIVRHFLNIHRIHLTIQVDPIDRDNQTTREIYHKVKKTIKSINQRLSIHSLRVIYNKEFTQVLFDILEDFDLNITKDIIDLELSKNFNLDEFEFIYTIDRPLI